MTTVAAPDSIKRAVAAALPLAESLFAEVKQKTGDGVGVSRESYSPAERVAIDVLAHTAKTLGLGAKTDPFGNFYMTLAGADRNAPAWIIGSHIDSVPSGGNYDGLAGVVAGLTAVVALQRAGITPPRDITVMAIRAEELSAWYGGSHNDHIGSRAALGLLPQVELDSAINIRTGRTLREHMCEAGFNPEAIKHGVPWLVPTRFKGYLELHIEQGPVLEGKGIPVGVVTAIRGSARARSCRCVGEYTHCGAVPHEYRSDAVMATVELVRELDQEWERARNRGGDLVLTVGKFFTDAKVHAVTKVPGEVNFAIDFRSQDEATLTSMKDLAQALAQKISTARRVEFNLGTFSLHRPAQMSPAFRSAMLHGCRELGITAMEIPSGAGHDAQDFAHAGIPAAMIFVCNAHGSHNPREAMEMSDFALGAQLLTWMLTR